MTRPIPTANVLVSFDRASLLPLVTKFSTITDIQASLSEEDKEFIFLQSGKGGVFSFDHSFNMGDDGAEVITLQFVDPNNEFEFKMVQLISRYLRDRKQEVANEIKDIEDYIDFQTQLLDVQDKAAILAFSKDERIQNTLAPGPSLLDYSNINTDIILSDELIAAYKDVYDFYIKEADIAKQEISEQISTAKKQIADIIGTPKIKGWIMYGCGDKIKAWSPPIFMELLGSDYYYSGEGSRKLTLKFAATNTAFTDLLDEHSLRGVKTLVRSDTIPFASAKNLSLTPGAPSVTAYVPIGEIISEDLHGIITRALTSYLIRVTGNKNILVVLPDLNQSDLHKKYISKIDAAMARAKELHLVGEGVPFHIKYQAISSVLEELGFEIGSQDSLDHLKNNLYDLIPEARVEALSTDHFSTQFVILRKSQHENFFGPIKRVFSNLQTYVPFSFEGKWESNADVLGVLATPIDEFRLIHNPANVAYICGSEVMIRRYVYAQRYLETLGLSNPDINDQGRDLAMPSSLEILFNRHYMEAMARVLYQDSDEGCFSDLSLHGFDTPFALINEDDLSKQLEAANILTFKSGTANSNVLKFNIRSDAQYLALLEQISVRVDESHFDPALGKSPFESSELVALGSKYTLEDIKDLVSFFESIDFNKREELARKIKLSVGLDVKDIRASKADIAKYLMDLVTLNPDVVSKIELPTDVFESSVFTEILSLMFRLLREGRKGIVTVLPTFHAARVSNPYPALFLVRENRISGVGESHNPINSNLTGWWTVLGFRHRISTSNIDSSFYIVQSGADTNPPETTKAVAEIAEPQDFALTDSGNNTSEFFKFNTPFGLLDPFK